VSMVAGDLKASFWIQEAGDFVEDASEGYE
jgi:hypothetical protein